MQIREVDIYHFGKLQERKICFAPGINVVYGANEAGKSTLHAFLTAMLFGLEKNRGRAKSTDGYLRYEPWHAPAYYSGALRFTVDGRRFCLERNFYHKEKREILRNEEDGEELSVAYGDLAMLLGGIGKETYGNTYDIPQSGASTAQELGRMLAEYMADVSEGGSAGIHVAQALELLERKRKELNADLRNEKERKQREEQTLVTERELLEQDCLRLRNGIAAETALMSGQEHVEDDVPGREHHTSRIAAYFGSAVFFAAMLLNGLFYRASAHSAALFWIAEAGLGAAAAALLFLGWRKRRRQREAAEVAGGQRKAAETAGGQSGRLLFHMQEALAEKKTRLYNIAERLETLKTPGERERELLTCLDAVLMAKEEIGTLAGEFGEEQKDVISSEVSRYVSAFTGGRYDRVRVDESGKLRVYIEGREVPPEALSRGTLEQFYLAFRIAAGNVVMKEETMPLLLDETFCMYDDARLAQTLRVISGLGMQVILFTCQRREMNLLEDAGIPYHRIEMEI